MQNNLENRRTGEVEKNGLDAAEANPFKRQDMMPNNNPKQVGNKVIDSFNQEPVALTGAENEMNLDAPIFGEEQTISEPEGTINEQKITDKNDFSKSKNFTKNDEGIIEMRIRELKKDPAAAYGKIQEDREEYRKNSFGQTFGEQK